MKNKKGFFILFSLFILIILTTIYMVKLFATEDIVLIEIENSVTAEAESKLLIELEGVSDTYANLLDTDLNNIDVDGMSKYKIDAYFDEENMKIDVLQVINYTNTEDSDLESIQLHVFTNAFKREETSPTTLSTKSYAYPNGFSSGYTVFETIKVNGQDVMFELLGYDETSLVITLNEALKVSEKVDIDLIYSVKIPNCRDRFGYDEQTIQIANWYPILSVYENNAWNENPYYKIGDPFYTETSSYELELDVPIDYIVAATGVKEDIYIKNDNRKIYKMSSDFTRDFAIVMSKYFNVESKVVDGTRISTYTYTDDDDDEKNVALESGERTLKSFNDMFGKYPYTDVAIVETSFPSGMEYPGLVMIGNSYYGKGSEDRLEDIVNHEMGHQWWYSIVGNNQITESWLDEGLTSYSEILYKEYFEKDEYDFEVSEIEKTVARGNKRFDDTLVVKPLSEFENWDDYGFLTYGKSQMFFIKYRDTYGEEKLKEALKLHFEKNKFGIATTEGIIKTFEVISGESISDISDEFLFQGK
ncbi:MAG: M1 family metallopeptidase [Acidaminobacteraceae bacterium]